MNKKAHWEKVYSTKEINEVSWYQQTPTESLDFIKQMGINKESSIIDIGGGDSLLVDHLLELGFTNISVLDISEVAINKAKARLGEKASKVNWIVSDVLHLDLGLKFECWHDRAAFHFLQTEEEIENYVSIAQKHVSKEGKLIVGTFSTEGPEKCSGLPVKQYNDTLISATLQKWFEKIKCVTVDHITPFNTIQNFMFCSFKKLNTQNGHS